MKKVLFAIMALLCTMSASAKSYKVGELYDENGLKGIVIRVDATGEHGLIMSLKTCPEKWLEDKDAKLSTNFFYEDDGEKNMAAAEKYINDNGKSWDMFPFFKWCRNLGNGWYAPAIDEVKDIVIATNGDFGKVNEKNIKAIDKIIKANKGDTMKKDMLSSTEGDNGSVRIIMCEGLIGKPKFKEFPWLKTSKLTYKGSRAVHKF